MIEMITNVNSAVNNVVWGWPALILLGFTGVLMTSMTGFFQLSHLGLWLKDTIGSIFSDRNITRHTEDRSISQFQSLCTALAATVGTGNIVGVAGAIAVGGPGAVFWMWLIAFFGMMTNYSENVLGILYRRKNSKDEWAGGAMYYLKDGLGERKGCKKLGAGLAVLFSCFCLLASFGIGNMSQVNSMVSNVYTAFGIPKLATGIFLFVAVSLVVIGGLKRIAAITEKVVPFMVLLYLLGTLDLTTGQLTGEAAAIESSALVSYAFGNHFGFLGSAFVAVAILLFAYSTVLGWSHYGATACEYLFGTGATKIYRMVFAVVVLAGSVMKAQLAWDISDTFNGLMMLPNLIGVITLSPVVMRCTKNYVARNLHGKDVEPMLSMFPEIQKMQEEALKEELREDADAAAKAYGEASDSVVKG